MDHVLINYEELLRRYMEHVLKCEGTDFVSAIGDDWSGFSDVKFSAEEIEVLKSMARDI